MKKLILLTSAAVLAASLSSHGQVATSFNVDLSPDAQTFVSPTTAALTLNYTIDGSGNIALVADDGGASPARWNQVSNATAGSTSSAALFNTAFALTYSGSANAILNYPVYDNAGTGSVLATQQGNAAALENGEYITFTVSGTATAVSGFSLGLVDFSYDNRLGNGSSSFGVNDTIGTVVEQLIPNTSTFGTLLGSGILLAAGESMTFRTIDGNAGGAGLSGFNFNVSATAIPEPGSFALLGGLCALTAMALRRR